MLALALAPPSALQLIGWRQKEERAATRRLLSSQQTRDILPRDGVFWTLLAFIYLFIYFYDPSLMSDNNRLFPL